MRIRTLLLLAGLLLSPMAWGHGGHDPVFFQGWLGWKHWLANALAAPAVALGIGAALAGAGLLCWLWRTAFSRINRRSLSASARPSIPGSRLPGGAR